jgi:hypothetical protein
VTHWEANLQATLALASPHMTPGLERLTAQWFQISCCCWDSYGWSITGAAGLVNKQVQCTNLIGLHTSLRCTQIWVAMRLEERPSNSEAVVPNNPKSLLLFRGFAALHTWAAWWAVFGCPEVAAMRRCDFMEWLKTPWYCIFSSIIKENPCILTVNLARKHIFLKLQTRI